MTNLVDKIAEAVRTIGIKVSYGDPVSVDGSEIVPVAIGWFGFGGGSDGEAENEAGGGGGGGASIPIGAYVKSGASARFEPNIVALAAVLIPLTWVTGKALSSIIRALKK